VFDSVSFNLKYHTSHVITTVIIITRNILHHETKSTFSQLNVNCHI